MPPRKRSWVDDPRNPAAAALRGKNIVQNKNAADLQVTAEQLIIDSYDLHRRNNASAASRQSDLVITSREELMAHQQAKRQKLEEIARRDTSRLGPWMAYAAWEERQGDVGRVRDAFESALQYLGRRADVWSYYAKAELRCGTAHHAQQVLRRANKALPANSSLWLQALLLERCIGTSESVRELFGQWLSFRPGDAAWKEWARFEISVAAQEEDSHNQNDGDANSGSSSRSRNRFDRARSVLARYVSEHNTADAWLFYASCERELMSPSGSSRQAVKVLQTALQAIPETERSREDAARLALATARALEADGDDDAARAIYVQLLDEFFDSANMSNETENDADDDSSSSNKQQREFSDRLRDAVCDALVTLEKRCGTAQAAAAVEERKRRWELQRALSRSNGADFAARLELLQLERAALHQQQQQQQQQRSAKNKQQALTSTASFYEQVCFPSAEELEHMQALRQLINNSSLDDQEQRAMSSSALLDELSVAWESFALFCEQDLESPTAAVDVFRRAVELLESVEQSASSSFSTVDLSGVDLLCNVIEQTALVHLRALDEQKFRLCMQLSAKLSAASSSQPSSSATATTTTTTTTTSGGSLFSVLRRWAEIEGEVHGASGMVSVLRHGLQYRQCRERAAVWHSLADSLEDQGPEKQLEALEEGLETLRAYRSEEGDEDGAGGESPSDIGQWLEHEESVSLEMEEAAIDSVFARLFRLRMTLATSAAKHGEPQQNQHHVSGCQRMLEQRLESHISQYVRVRNAHKSESSDAVAAAASSSSASFSRRDRLMELAESLAQLLRTDLSMQERFFFATQVESAAVESARRVYRSCTTDVRKRCGEQATKSIVEMWKKFEDVHGDEESRRMMDRTANAVATRSARLFNRAHQAEKK